MDHYLLIKALHVMSFTSWMAGLFYLPRLLAYHASVATGSGEDTLLQVMERRLLGIIMRPAMIATWVFGVWLVIITGYGGPGTPAPWLHYKLVLVLVLSGLHGYFASGVRAFAKQRNTKTSRFYKIINEAVTLLFVAIVLLAVTKPL